MHIVKLDFTLYLIICIMLYKIEYTYIHMYILNGVGPRPYICGSFLCIAFSKGMNLIKRNKMEIKSFMIIWRQYFTFIHF